MIGILTCRTSNSAQFCQEMVGGHLGKHRGERAEAGVDCGSWIY